MLEDGVMATLALSFIPGFPSLPGNSAAWVHNFSGQEASIVRCFRGVVSEQPLSRVARNYEG